MAGRGKARRGEAGEAGQGRQGRARQGEAWPGTAGHGRQGPARQGRARQGMAGKAGKAGRGLARHGGARHGMALSTKQNQGVVRLAKRTPKARLEQIYKWRAGHAFAVDATTIAGELAAINAEQGRVKPQDFVDRERPDDAPGHAIFEWDDSVAGEQWRLQQARTIIRALHVTRSDDDAGGSVYVNVKPVGEDRSYQSVTNVLQRPDLLASAIQILTAKVVAAETALMELRNLASGLGDEERAKVIALGEALSAAGALARSLRAA